MKDKAIGLGLVLAVAGTIAGVSFLAHKVGDPSWAAPVITGLTSAFGLAVMWLRQPPGGPPALPTGGAS